MMFAALIFFKQHKFNFKNRNPNTEDREQLSHGISMSIFIRFFFFLAFRSLWKWSPLYLWGKKYAHGQTAWREWSPSFAQLLMASGTMEMNLIRQFLFAVHVRKWFLNEFFFFLLDFVKPLSLNEVELHEKKWGHVTIQLFESDVKREKKNWHFWGGKSQVFLLRNHKNNCWKPSHFQRETSLKVMRN